MIKKKLNNTWLILILLVILFGAVIFKQYYNLEGYANYEISENFECFTNKCKN